MNESALARAVYRGVMVEVVVMMGVIGVSVMVMESDVVLKGMLVLLGLIFGANAGASAANAAFAVAAFGSEKNLLYM